MFNQVIQNLIFKIILKFKPTQYIQFVIRILENINPEGKEKVIVSSRMKRYEIKYQDKYKS